MRHEQTQLFCRRCGDYMLHSRDVETVPHLLHALVTLFLCGLWIPIWILHAISIGNPGPFLCSHCGQAQGRGTPEEIAAQKAQQAEIAAQRAEKRREEVAATYAAVRDWFASLPSKAERAAHAAQAVAVSLHRGMARADRALGAAMGDPGDLLHWFFRGLLGVAMAVALFLIGYSAATRFSGEQTSTHAESQADMFIDE